MAKGLIQALATMSQHCRRWGRCPGHHGRWQSPVHWCRLAGPGLEVELASSLLKHFLAANMGCSDFGETLSGVAKGLGWVVIVPLVSLMPQTLIPVVSEGGSPAAGWHSWVS